MRTALAYVMACLVASSAIAQPTPSRLVTPWGDPDLQGIWDFRTATPFQRRSEFGERRFFTEEEAAEFERDAVSRRLDEIRRGAGEAGVELWPDFGSVLTEDRRTSLVVDPSSGRVPSLTPEAERRRRVFSRRVRAARAAQDRRLSDRCIMWTPTPIAKAYANNFVQLFQTPDHVVIYHEMIHDVRVIPLDGRPHLSRSLRQLRGDSRGRWEDDTLVVETTNFTDQNPFRGAGAGMHLVERFTRIDGERLRYQYTVRDPAAFSRPWSADVPMRRTAGPLYEYACHEGNRGLVGILLAARAAEDAERFVGAFQLSSSERHQGDGRLLPSPYVDGTLTYDDRGRVSMHLVQASGARTEYSGSYEVNFSKRSVRHEIEGGNARGESQIHLQHYSFESAGHVLILTESQADGGATRVRWERHR